MQEAAPELRHAVAEKSRGVAVLAPPTTAARRATLLPSAQISSGKGPLPPRSSREKPRPSDARFGVAGPYHCSRAGGRGERSRGSTAPHGAGRPTVGQGEQWLLTILGACGHGRHLQFCLPVGCRQHWNVTSKGREVKKGGRQTACDRYC